MAISNGTFMLYYINEFQLCATGSVITSYAIFLYFAQKLREYFIYSVIKNNVYSVKTGGKGNEYKL